jgi:hypothetical protein
MRSAYFNQAKKNDFPVYAPPEGELFNWGIEYNKGGFVLHMLRRTVGEDAFRRILQNYFIAYRYGNASTRDFQGVCESVTGTAMDWFFNEWIFKPGYMTVQYSWESRPAGGPSASVLLRMRQTGDLENAFHMPLDIRARAGAAESRDTTVWVIHRTERFEWTLPFRPDTLIVDPENSVLLKSERVSSLPDSLDRPLEEYTLRPNYPNPFSRSTSVVVDCSIPFFMGSRNVRLCVYNMLGAKVRTLAPSIRADTLTFTREWDGRDDSGRSLPSGVYVIRLEGDSVSAERKAVLSR